MKDILHIMRFDFLTAKPIAMKPVLFMLAMFGGLSLFISPIIITYTTFAALVFVIPLQSAADKSGFHKLYGILPVERKSITRGRFLYLFSVHFLFQLIEFAVMGLSFALGLNRLLPNQDSAAMQMVQESFADKPLAIKMGFGIFAFICILFSYMEMMGQIFGRENEMKIIMLTLAVITVIGFAFAFLSEHDIIPAVSLPELPQTVGGTVLLGIAVDLVTLGLCLLFGEITAKKLAGREL